MADDLSKYVSDARKGGMTDAAIRDTLTKAGWPAETVDAALAPIAASAAPVAPLAPPEIRQTIPPGIAPAEAPVQPQPSAQLSGSNKPKRKILGAVIAVIVLLLLGGGGFAVYKFQLLPFGTKVSDADLLAHLADKLSGINSAEYSYSMSIQSAPRDAGTKPIAVSFPEFDKQKALYDRDTQRLSAISQIRSALITHFNARKVYPASLAAIKDRPKNITSTYYYYYPNVSINDPLSNQEYGYQVTNGGADYALTVTFETQAAIDNLKKYHLAAQGQAVTFTRESQSYLGYITQQEPYFVSFFRSQDMYLGFLPTDLNITFNVSGTTESGGDAAKSLDARFELGGNLQAGDFAASADVAFLKKADTYYTDIVKFPSLFFDLSPIKNKWVEFSLADIGGGIGGWLISADSIQSWQKQRDSLLSQTKFAYTLAEQEGVFTFANKNDGKGNIRHFGITVVREKIAPFYKDLMAQLDQKFGADALMKFDETTYEYLQGSAFTDLYTYASQNGSFDVWVDAATGFPTKFTTTFRLIPPDAAAKLKDIQYNETMTLAMNNVNQPVTIEVPRGAISYDDAQVLLSGQPKDIYLYNKQMGNVQSLRSSLDAYKAAAGSYPDSLSALTTTHGDAKKLNPNPASTTAPYYYDDSAVKFLPIVPNDPFTRQPYTYAKFGDDYRLTYTIQTPTSTSTSNGTGFFGMIYNPYANVKVVDGTNTATNKSFSLEGDARGTVYKSGDDATKISDLRQVQNSLELFFNKNGHYPIGISSWSTLQSKIQNAGIGVSNLPDDHRAANGTHYCYAADAQGQNYVASASLEGTVQSQTLTGYSGAVPSGGGMKCTCGAPNYCVAL